jgi:GAF domain-containing protein/HAMP domain-containing protein
VIIAVISVFSLLSAGEQAQDTSAQVLRSQIQESLEHQTVETALKNDIILERTSQDARDIAQQAAYILENPDAFNTEAFWVADENMFFGPEGQYINGTENVSTVYVPNTIEITDEFKQRLELLAYLDIAFVPVFEGNPNAVAIYFIGKDEISWLYPNINLGSIVPPDYLATQDIFYTIGAPKNNPTGEVVWTPVYDDPAGQGLLVSAIAPVYTSADEFMGVIGIDISLAGLTATIEQEDFGTGAYAFLLDTDGRALALPEQGYRDLLGRERGPDEFGVDMAASVQEEITPLLENILSGETRFESVVVSDQELFIAYVPLSTTDWYIASVANAEQVLAPATALRTELQQLSTNLVTQRLIPVGVVLIALVVVAGIFFTNLLVKPIEKLTEGAAQIGAGEWDTFLPESELREINALSSTLSNMATQIKGTLDTLEQRVAERTENLELAAEVGRTVSQVSDLDSMLTQATRLILEQFDLYYVQVYLTDLSQSVLKLEAGTGEVGAQLRERSHSLPLSTASLNGRAAIEKRPVVISDTEKSLNFRPNPLLPDTRGEMALPLIAGDKVVGVLDLQTRYPGKLTEELLPAYEALAGQLAVAIQNATLLEEAEQARAEVEAQARRQIRASWDEHLDGIHMSEEIGFVYDRKEVLPLAETTELPDESQAVSASIALTGEELGSLVVELDEESKNDRNRELISIVARQMAQQLENLRLLESAERFRHEAEQAARRQTREGWQEYIKSRSGDSLGYLYDLKEVRPFSNGKDDAEALTLPLKARDEKVGKLSIKGLTPDDDESFDLANAVAERLGAHIESLRLLEETKRGQFELDKRAQQLAAVAEISTASSQELDVEKLLGTVVQLAQRQFDLYHAHVFVYNEATEELQIMACGWKEGDENEGTNETASISLSQEQSLVARAARTRQAVIVNDVKSEPGWLANPLLPDTASEMAVPLVIGDQVLGVMDVQADRINAFTEEDANIQTTLASQVATAMQNARSFTRAQKQAERETMLNTINQKIQSATSVEAVLQIAARELGHALGAPMTIAQLSMRDKN